jgi:glycosyltransferase involved in cell wall biosynthesis
MEISGLTTCIFTEIPSPYQVELFDALAQHGAVRPQVVYLYRAFKDRMWQTECKRHDHVFVYGNGQDRAKAQKWVESASVVIFGNYRDGFCNTQIRRRARTKKPWCFWGERPGFRGLEVLGKLYRRWRLAPLYSKKVPIWGMGSWAVKGYQSEFGGVREYCNIPYFSDLSRFRVAAENRSTHTATRRFLFSGSLIYRKGVDLLAEAFIRLARELPGVSLDYVGHGPLQSPLRSRLQEVGSRVRFHGFCPWEGLPERYRDADILCVPSRYDGWGLVVPEGLAAGLPVIATDKTGAALDLIFPGQNGWLTKASDVDSLHQAMREAALLSPAELRCASEAAQQSVAGHSLQHGVTRFVSAVAKTLECWDWEPV